MIELDFVTLENGIDYGIIDTLEMNDNKYLFMVNEHDPKDVQIRKVEKDNGDEYLVKLDSNEEYDEVMTEYKINKDRKDDKDEE